MSLYDGLLDVDNHENSTTKKVASDWSSSYKMLQSQRHQVQSKKNLLHGSTKKNLKNAPTLPPVLDLKNKGSDGLGGAIHFNPVTGKIEQFARAAALPLKEKPVFQASPFIGSEPVPPFAGVIDEYDPLHPNDYDMIIAKRKKEKQKEEENRENTQNRENRENRDNNRDNNRENRENRDNNRREPRDRYDRGQGERYERDDRRRYDRNRGRDDRYSERGEMERSREGREQEEEERSQAKPSGAAIAPPSMLLEEPPIQDCDLSMETEFERPRSPKLAQSMGLGGSAAEKIMMKYGYKEGQGLGRKEQGMSTALVVEKTSKRGGKIIHEKDLPKDQPKESVPNTNLLKNPSKVVLLKNMVGPGEVDEELEGETSEECNVKYGKVVRCIIFEIPNVDHTEAVRIFVEFERIDHAIKAVMDLNGRYFGGRVVTASFYNLDKFRRLDLAESAAD